MWHVACIESKSKEEKEIVTDVKRELNYTLGVNESYAISYFQKTIYCLQLSTFLKSHNPLWIFE
jgi:hypothetical protein